MLAYSITDSTPPCLMLSLICMVLVFPYCVLIVDVRFCLTRIVIATNFVGHLQYTFTIYKYVMQLNGHTSLNNDKTIGNTTNISFTYFIQMNFWTIRYLLSLLICLNFSISLRIFP